MLCGCSPRSDVEGQTFVVDESVDGDDASKSDEFPAEPQAEDVAKHFDLSAIKFIDDEEPDDDDGGGGDGGSIVNAGGPESLCGNLSMCSR